MRYWIRSFVLTAMILVFANLCDIPESAAEGQKFALVIGNSAYKVGKLKNPVNDANDMEARLKSLGFRVTKLTDANQQEMEDAINAFGRKLQGDGTGLFFFAGHGVQVEGFNYLIPIGANIDSEGDVKYFAVNANRVLSKMQDAGNPLNMVFLDACRNNPFSRRFRNALQGLAPMDAPRGSLVVYATAPGDVAADGDGRNGVFTKNLLYQMDKPGLEIGPMLRRVNAGVQRDTGGKQTPFVVHSLTGDFYFVKRSESRPSPVASVAPNLPQSASPSLDQFLKESEARRLETEKWDQWQKNRESDYEKILKIDKDPYLAKDRKKEAWRIFLASVSQDNPYSYKDDEMRDYSKSRFEYWENYREEPEKAKLFVNTAPSAARVRILNISPRFRQGMELDPGRYHVEASADGFETRKEWVNLGPGEEKKLEYRLEKTRETVSLLGETPQSYASLDPATTRAKIVKRDRHFEKYDTGVVKDTNTGLEWYVGPDKGTNWHEAEKWVKNLSVGGGGWRMPKVAELQKLYEKGKGSRNMSPLLETTGWFVWSGEKKEGSSGARGFTFFNGREYWYHLDRSYSSFRSFAVRSR